MAGVTLEHITKIFHSKQRDVRAVDDLSLSIEDREFVVLVGPSGCGKTTTLRLIAGLEELSAGTIRIGGRIVNGIAPKDRYVAMVFQNYALYPHMTVFRNMAFGLKMRRTPRDQIKRRVGEVAQLLHLEHVLDRKPAALSGGECQRVALGRAIVRRPNVFLFDEPLSNLDAALRGHLRTELKSLHQNLGTTTIYVTHDQEEAMTLGSRIVVLNGGRVQQCGTPLAVYNHPVNRFVAGFIGTPPMNFLEGRLESDGGAVCFVGDVGRVVVPPEAAEQLKASCGQPVVLGIRPQHVRLDSARRTAAQGCSNGRSDGYSPFVGDASVLVVEPLGNSIHVHLNTVGGEHVVARISPDKVLSPGDRVRLEINLSYAHVFAADACGKRLNGALG